MRAATAATAWSSPRDRSALDPSRGELVAGGVVEQTERVLDESRRRCCDGADVGFADVVKTTVFLADMQDFRP